MKFNHGINSIHIFLEGNERNRLLKKIQIDKDDLEFELKGVDEIILPIFSGSISYVNAHQLNITLPMELFKLNIKKNQNYPLIDQQKIMKSKNLEESINNRRSFSLPKTIGGIDMKKSKQVQNFDSRFKDKKREIQIKQIEQKYSRKVLYNDIE